MRPIVLALVLGTMSAAPAPSSGSRTPNELDTLLAPVALYPDQLLAQMLLCASKPATVGALAEWLRSHEALEGSELQDAARSAGFASSFVAIVIFPDVITAMATQIDRTTRLGQAFTSDRSAVFASVQRLRARAREAGTLKTTPQQQVETRTTSEGQQVIVIEPANPQIVYVPQYNPQVVYTQPTSTTVVVQQESQSNAAAAGLIGFTAGIAIGAAMDNDYYYGPYGWRGGAYMYNDGWDDYFDAREDAREDWMDHREDIVEDRGDTARATQEQRTERQQNRQDTTSTTQTQRTERRSEAQASTATTSQESRGYSRDAGSGTER